jgi:hypothetical protein
MGSTVSPRRAQVIARLAVLTAVALCSTRAAGADTLNLAWDPNPEPNVSGYVVRVGTTPGAYTRTFDVGLATTWSFTGAIAGQRYCFVVAAYAPEVGEGPNSAEVCGSSNAPPVFTNPGSISGNVGQAATLQLVASDPDGMPVTYTAAPLPPGMTLAPSTGFISGTPTTAGSYAVRATASDGILMAEVTFTWTVAIAVPAAARLVSPSGAIATATPTYVWESVPTATHYRLWVEDTTAIDPRIQIVYSSAEAGCSGGGTCRVTPATALAPGDATWSIRASNAGGEGPFSSALAFMVPSGTPPTVTVQTPTTSPTYSTTAATLALAGSASDDRGVAQVSWSNARGGSGTATGTTSWSVSGIALATGSNVITVTARDADGNIGTDAITVTRTDAEAPVVTITSPTTAANLATTQSTIALGGTGVDAFGVSQVTWTSDRGPSGTATGTSSWTIASIPLVAGANTITVTAVDAAGNSGTDSIVVTATDAGAPTVVIQTPTTAATFTANGTSVSLGGGAADDFGVTQVTWSNNRGGNGVASGTTSWTTAPIALQTGDNTITVTSRDAAGNSGSDVLVVRRADGADTTAPAVTIAAPTTSSLYFTAKTALPLGGTASDAVGVTEVRWVNSLGGSGTAVGTTSWTVLSVPLLVGNNMITVSARDAAGNTASDVITIWRFSSSTSSIGSSTP